MPLLHVHDVSYSWEDTATPDDGTVELQLDRTCHEFYPALRELVHIYDAVRHEQEAEFGIGTADLVSLCAPDGNPELVRVDFPPVRFTVERAELLESLRSLLAEVFEAKSQMSNSKERERGLANIQSYIDTHNGETDVRSLYQTIINSE